MIFLAGLDRLAFVEPALASDLRDESLHVQTSPATGESGTSTDTSVCVADMEVRDLFLWMT